MSCYNFCIVPIGEFVALMRKLGIPLPQDAGSWWTGLGLDDFDAGRVVTRLEAAVALDDAFDLFSNFDVDYMGRIAW